MEGKHWTLCRWVHKERTIWCILRCHENCSRHFQSLEGGSQAEETEGPYPQKMHFNLLNTGTTDTTRNPRPFHAVNWWAGYLTSYTEHIHTNTNTNTHILNYLYNTYRFFFIHVKTHKKEQIADIQALSKKPEVFKIFGHFVNRGRWGFSFFFFVVYKSCLYSL